MIEIEDFAAELREMAGSDAYADKFRAGLSMLIFAAGFDEENRTAVTMSGEATEEIITFLALILHSSDECSSPTKTRALCDQIARKLQRRISEARAQAAAGGMDFMQTVHVPDRLS